MERADGGRPASKVARVIEQYGLEGQGDELEAAWTGENGSRTSLRDLADEFNRSVLEAALREVGASTTEYDVEATYRVLTDDDVMNADTLQKERELANEGVDVPRLRSDFVTHQAIHTYLTEYRDAELPDRSTDPDAAVETVERLEGRIEAVGQSKLSALVDAGAITDREYGLFVDVQVVCEECGRGYGISELVGHGGCDC